MIDTEFTFHFLETRCHRQPTMIIDPYKSVGGLIFGASLDEAKLKLGCPSKGDRSRYGRAELYYEQFILRFDPQTSLFIEFTALPSCELSLWGQNVSWDLEFLNQLYQTDKEMVDLYGFIVSFAAGIAVSGFHDGDEAGKAIHVFQRGVWRIEPDDNPKPWSPQSSCGKMI